MKKVFFYDIHRLKTIKSIGIVEDNGCLTNILLNSKDIKLEISETAVINAAYRQLTEYFAGERKEFELPIQMCGTNFQKMVWNELIKIPYGHTKSYREIAENINNQRAYRAVGNANNKNPLPIIIPCHRVISSNGSLAGYGAGIDVKLELLNIERSSR